MYWIKKLFRKTYVVDINQLPKEYKTGSLEQDIKKYEKDFNINVLPVDPSIKNTHLLTPLTFIKV